MSRSSRGKNALSDEDKIKDQLESLREGYIDQRIFDASASRWLLSPFISSSWQYTESSSRT